MGIMVGAEPEDGSHDLVFRMEGEEGQRTLGARVSSIV